MPWQHEQESVTDDYFTTWLPSSWWASLWAYLWSALPTLLQTFAITEKPGYWFQICEAKCNLYSTIYYPTTPHLIPSSPISQPQSVRNQRVCLTNKFWAKDFEKRTTVTMPSVEKLLHFLSSSIICAAGVCILGYGMSADWASAEMSCAPSKNEAFNGSSSLEIGLFNGTENKIIFKQYWNIYKVYLFKNNDNIVLYMYEYHCYCHINYYCKDHKCCTPDHPGVLW